MTAEQFAAFLKQQKDSSELMMTELKAQGAAQLESFKALLADNGGDGGDDGDGDSDDSDDDRDDKNENFVSKKDHEDLQSKFDTMQEEFNKLKKDPAGETQEGDDDDDLEDDDAKVF